MFFFFFALTISEIDLSWQLESTKSLAHFLSIVLWKIEGSRGGREEGRGEKERGRGGEGGGNRKERKARKKKIIVRQLTRRNPTC